MALVEYADAAPEVRAVFDDIKTPFCPYCPQHEK
jgi:hypothetical protein